MTDWYIERLPRQLEIAIYDLHDLAETVQYLANTFYGYSPPVELKHTLLLARRLRVACSYLVTKDLRHDFTTG